MAVFLAADATPLDIILHVPALCESKVSLVTLPPCQQLFVTQHVMYAFLPLKAALGRAAGVARDVVAVSIVERENSQLTPQVKDIISKVEEIFI